MEPFLGQISTFAFGIVPQGWVPCEGQTLNITQYQALYALLGTTFGGNGTTTFCLPDLRGRVAVGPEQGALQGASFGVASVVLQATQVPSHTHKVFAVSEEANQPLPTGNYFCGESFNLYADPPTDGSKLADAAVGTVGGTGHENQQPYLAVQYCIALQGIWPPRN